MDTLETPVARVAASPEALALLERLKTRHGEVMFYQSHGCCDGSTPMCLRVGEMTLGQVDVRLGSVGGVPF